MFKGFQQASPRVVAARPPGTGAAMPPILPARPPIGSPPAGPAELRLPLVVNRNLLAAAGPGADPRTRENMAFPAFVSRGEPQLAQYTPARSHPAHLANLAHSLATNLPPRAPARTPTPAGMAQVPPRFGARPLAQTRRPHPAPGPLAQPASLPLLPQPPASRARAVVEVMREAMRRAMRSRLAPRPAPPCPRPQPAPARPTPAALKTSPSPPKQEQALTLRRSGNTAVVASQPAPPAARPQPPVTLERRPAAVVAAPLAPGKTSPLPAAPAPAPAGLPSPAVAKPTATPPLAKTPTPSGPQEAVRVTTSSSLPLSPVVGQALPPNWVPAQQAVPAQRRCVPPAQDVRSAPQACPQIARPEATPATAPPAPLERLLPPPAAEPGRLPRPASDSRPDRVEKDSSLSTAAVAETGRQQAQVSQPRFRPETAGGLPAELYGQSSSGGSGGGHGQGGQRRRHDQQEEGARPVVESSCELEWLQLDTEVALAFSADLREMAPRPAARAVELAIRQPERRRQEQARREPLELPSVGRDHEALEGDEARPEPARTVCPACGNWLGSVETPHLCGSCRRERLQQMLRLVLPAFPVWLFTLRCPRLVQLRSAIRLADLPRYRTHEWICG